MSAARDSFFCVVEPLATADGTVVRPNCAPTSNEAAERFSAFKASINRAAVVMGLNLQVDATNAIIDVQTYHLMIHIAQRLVSLLTREGEEIPDNVSALAAADPSDFVVVASDIPQLEALMSSIERGGFGRWIPPAPPTVEKLPKKRLAAIAGAGLLISAAMFLVPKEWTLYGIRPHEVRPGE